MYEILVEAKAESDLRGLPVAVFRRIVPHLHALAEQPRPHGCRKITGAKNDWRIRVGDYRILYEIDDESKAVRVMRVRHRSEAYR
jgi:mRNA interferase RelE/StbE